MSGFADILKTVAPALATAIGGPLAGAAVSFLASKLGVDPAVVEQTVAGMGPADLVKLKQMDLDFKIEMAKIGISLDLAQIGVNTEEAKSTDLFVAGGRPFILWVCGIAFAYVAIVEPLARFVAQVGFQYHGAFPAIDTTLTLQVLGGLLGLGSLRTVEKLKGVAS